MNTFETIVSQLRKELKDSTLGFAETKTPMQKERVQNTLSKLGRYNGTVLTEKELILSYLLIGGSVEKVENYQYTKRNGELSKPRTAYKLYTDDRTYFEISKTAFDFANYVINNKLVTIETVINFIELENAEHAKIEQLKQQKEQQEREEMDHKRQEEKQQAEAIRAEKVAQWNAQGNKLINDEIKQELKNVIINFCNTRNLSLSNDQVENFINNTFVGYVGNKAYAENQIKLMMNNELNLNNLNNALEKELYYHVFNLTDSMSKLEVKDALNKFYNGVTKKRYYQGTEVEKEKTLNKIKNILTDIVNNAIDKSNFNYLMRQNVKELKELQSKCAGLKVLFKNDTIIFNMNDQEIDTIQLNF